MSKHIKTSHGIVLLGACLLLALIFINSDNQGFNQGLNQLGQISKFTSLVNSRSQLAQVCGANTNFYIASSTMGSGSGADCNDAEPVSWFNDASNWGTGVGQIGPGTTMHLCGNITTNLVAQGSGTSGNPITIFFEPGATMSKPAWSGNIIQVDGLSYITIDGGASGQIGGYTGNPSLTNGVIESTDNGTNLGNQFSAVGVSGKESQHIIVKNLVIRNLYVHVPGLDDGSGEAVRTYWNDDGSTPSDWLVDNCIFHDMGIGFTIGYGPGSQNFTYSNSTAYNVNWGGNAGDDGSRTSLTNLVVTGDYFHDWVNWDQINDDNHHNGFYAWAESGGTLNSVTYSGNTLGVNSTAGTNYQTSDLFVSGAGVTGTVNVYNNTFIGSSLTSGPTNGLLFVWPGPGSITRIYNNTFIGGIGGGAAIGIQGGNGGTQTYDVKNNIAIGLTFIYVEGNASVSLNSSNNIGYDLATYANTQPPNVAFGWSSTDTGVFYTLTGWQAVGQALGHDFDNNMSTSSPNLNGSYVPQTGSPAIGAGLNLSSYFTADAAGVTRPSTGPWDIGAYQYCTSNCGSGQSSPPSPDTTAPSIPTNLATTSITSSSISLSWSVSTDPTVSGQTTSGLAGYKVYRNNTYLASVTSGTAYTDSSVSASTTYTYAVSAYDNASPANESAESSSISVTTLVVAPSPISGSCSTTVNQCTAGTFSDVTDTSSNQLWSCTGSNGGTTASCSVPIPPSGGGGGSSSSGGGGGGSSYIPPSPVISSVFTTPVGVTSMTITWSTSLPANSQVLYGLTQVYGSQTSLISTLTTAHSITLTNLQSNTVYHFKILSSASGSSAPSSDLTFTTGKSVTPTLLPQVPTTCSSNSSTLPSYISILKIGSTGANVTNLQTFLVIAGYTKQQYVTGYFGSITQSALNAYLAAHPPCKTSTIYNSTPIIQSLITNTQSTGTFTRTLILGSTGSDVKALQQFLNNHGYIVASTGNGSKGYETTYYGPATAAAISRFQLAHFSTILAPYGLTRGTGTFGPATMKVINSL